MSKLIWSHKEWKRSVYGHSKAIRMCDLTTTDCLLRTEEAKHPLVVVVEVAIPLREGLQTSWDSIYLKGVCSLFLWYNETLGYISVFIVCWIQWNLCLLKTNSLKLDSFILYKKSKAFSGQYSRKIIIVWSFLKASHIRMMQEMNASPARGTLHNINCSTAFSSVLVHLAKRKKLTYPVLPSKIPYLCGFEKSQGGN